MQIILLSGGSGKSLWPLSNDTRSKQFLKLLTAPDGTKESMLQRVVRQLRTFGLADHITVTTSLTQRDVVCNQVGEDISVVTEPERRGTFPAVLLTCAHLLYSAHLSVDEPIVVLPCDTFAADDYFAVLRHMVEAMKADAAPLLLMGIRPTHAATDYGYILPAATDASAPLPVARPVARFVEKPDRAAATDFVAHGAYWNGGVFGFRLRYIAPLLHRLAPEGDYDALRARYGALPATSFDTEVAERASDMAFVPYHGTWYDLGTWSTLTAEIAERAIGNVILDAHTEGTHVINELELPLMCIGARDMVITASPDGILVADKRHCEEVRAYANRLKRRPMYEERRWGEYRVIDTETLADGYKALTKQLTLHAGKSISYQLHHHRDEVWTFIDGRGLLVIDGKITEVGRGDTIVIHAGTLHAVRAVTDLRFIEVQSGDLLVEEDIERFGWEW